MYTIKYKIPKNILDRLARRDRACCLSKSEMQYVTHFVLKTHAINALRVPVFCLTGL